MRLTVAFFDMQCMLFLGNQFHPISTSSQSKN